MKRLLVTFRTGFVWDKVMNLTDFMLACWELHFTFLAKTVLMTH